MLWGDIHRTTESILYVQGLFLGLYFFLSLPLFALLAAVSVEYIKQLLIFRGIHDLWTPFLPSFLPHQRFSRAVSQLSLPAPHECLRHLSVNLHRLFLAVLPACQAKEILCHAVSPLLNLLFAMPIENLTAEIYPETTVYCSSECCPIFSSVSGHLKVSVGICLRCHLAKIVGFILCWYISLHHEGRGSELGI